MCFYSVCTCIDHKYDHFIVGLTNVSPNDSTPTLWNYIVCGQYLDPVPRGKTVSVYCRDNLPPFRYVIVQIPALNDYLVACEIEVVVNGMRMSNINILKFTTQADNCSMLLFFLHVEERLQIVWHDLLNYCLTC